MPVSSLLAPLGQRFADAIIPAEDKLVGFEELPSVQIRMLQEKKAAKEGLSPSVCLFGAVLGIAAAVSLLRR